MDLDTDSVMSSVCSEKITDDAANMARWYGKQQSSMTPMNAPKSTTAATTSPLPERWTDVVKEVRKSWGVGGSNDKGGGISSRFDTEIEAMQRQLRTLQQQHHSNTKGKGPHLHHHNHYEQQHQNTYLQRQSNQASKHHIARVAHLQQKMGKLMRNADRCEEAFRGLQAEMVHVQKELGYLHGDMVTQYEVRGTQPGPRGTRAMSYHRKK
eukprot:PhF_6_TR3363/c0_g1_i2/m.4786